MKRYLFLCLVAMFSFTTWAYDFSDDSSGTMFFYNIASDTEVKVTYGGIATNSGTDSYTGDITIPSTAIDDNGTTYTVISVGSYAFCGCKGLTNIEFPECVTRIESNAFQSCSALTHIEIPDQITYIGTGAFEASGLESVSFGNGLERINDVAFFNCANLTDINFGGVKIIGNSAFTACNRLSSVVIPNSVTGIECYAFAECSKLETVTIGSGVTSLEDMIFDFCSYLTSVTLLNPQPPIFDPDYSWEGCLFEDDFSVKVYVPAGTLDVYEEEFFNKYGIFEGMYGFGSYEELDYGVIKIDMEEEGIGYATYYNTDYDVMLPSGVIAYTTSSLTTENGDNMLIMDKVDETIPAGVAVVVRGAVGTYTAPAVSSEASSSDSYLHSNSTSTTTTSPDGGDYYFYKLSDEDGVGFYWQDSTGGAFTIAANQAWLAVPQAEAEGINALYMYFDEPFYGSFICDVDPESGSTVKELYNNITFYNPTEGGEIYVNDYCADVIEVYAEDETLVTQQAQFYPDFGSNGEEYSQTVYFEDRVSDEGTYYVNVPAELFFIYDEYGNTLYNEAMTLAYTISVDAGNQEPDYTLSFNPEDGSTLDVLSAISIYCENGITQVLMPDEEITITDAENNTWSGNYIITEVANDLGIVTEVVITLSPEIVDAGTYYVNVPAGYFDIGNQMNNAFTLTYTITGELAGISKVNINSDGVDAIYTIGGQRVSAPSKGGVYIVGRKKILIK